jgi:hypothetical protein
MRRQIPDQLPEVDSALGRVVENQPRSVEELLHFRQLHPQTTLADLQQTDAVRFLLPLLMLQASHDVATGGFANDRGVCVGCGTPARFELRNAAGHGGDGWTFCRLDDHGIARSDRRGRIDRTVQRQIRQKERLRAAGRCELDADERAVWPGGHDALYERAIRRGIPA